MFYSEFEVFKYIMENQDFLLSQMNDMEVKTLYKSEKSKINIIKSGNRLIKYGSYFGKKDITQIFKEMIELKLI